MARVTVEDCLDHVDNRFELVLVASKRARQLNGTMTSRLLLHFVKLLKAMYLKRF